MMDLAEYLRQAHIKHKIEQKYKEYDVEKGVIEHKRRTIPGDILVESWYDDKKEPAYMDITIGNVFCKTYVKGASKERFYVTRLKEKKKRKNIQMLQH